MWEMIAGIVLVQTAIVIGMTLLTAWLGALPKRSRQRKR